MSDDKDDKKEMSEEEIKQVTFHLDAACTILGMSFKFLFDANKEDETVGFLLGKKGVFTGDIETIEEDGLWTPTEKPKHLN